MSLPKGLRLIDIKQASNFVRDTDKADLRDNYFYDAVGVRNTYGSFIARKDQGTLHRYPVPPIRPNPFVNVLGLSGTVGGVITLQVDDASHISNGDNVFVDELSAVPSAIGEWPVINKQTTSPYTVIDSYSETNYSFDRPLFAGSNTKVGMAFIGNGQALARSTFYLKKHGSPTGNIVSSVYAATGTIGSTMVPTGAALATSNVVDAATGVGSAYGLVNFTFASPVVLTNLTDYVVTVEYAGGDSSDSLYVGVNAGITPPEGNQSLYNSGWTAQSNTAVCFYTYSQQTIYKFDLSGSVLGGGTYVSGGIVTEVPQTIINGYYFLDSKTNIGYDIVVTLDTSNNTHIYVYDPASSEASKWIELTRSYSLLLNGTPSAGSSSAVIDTVTENGVALTPAISQFKNFVAVNTSRSNQTVFITDNGALLLETDTVLGSAGLGWQDNDVIQIYRFPCFKFNWNASNGGVYYDPTQAAISPSSYTDGDVTIHGTVTLARDMYYKSLNVASDGILDTNNYRVFIQNPSVNNGIIHNNGNDAAGYAGGAAKSSGTYQSQGAGTNGGNPPNTGYGSTNGTAGSSGATRTTCLTNTAATLSGTGGPGASSAGGATVDAAGNGASPGASSTVTAVISPTLQDIVNAVVQIYIAPLPGGAGSGGMGGGSITNGVAGGGGYGGGTGAPTHSGLAGMSQQEALAEPVER